MNRFIQSGLNFILKQFDLILCECEQEWEREAFARLYESQIIKEAVLCLYPAEGIVFSKDRALQLHALLSSYLENVVSPAPLHILYRVSTSLHQKAYDEVIEMFSGKFSFTRQSSYASFKNDLVKLLESLHAQKVFFLVDDILVIEKFDINDFALLDTDKTVPSLRMGLNLKKCYTVQKEQPLPELMPNPDINDSKIFWKWDRGLYDWSYPLSVDGHYFSTQEITTMTKLINFSAPNTYEDQLQRFRRFFTIRTGVAYKKSKIVNIPCNKVQEVNKNIHGSIHQDFLLDKWMNGYQMDYRSMYGYINTSVHEEIPFGFIQR
ncbi:glycosyltransferase involved in cell wall biogenesis-like protein [Smithella sp. ME-1]|uniref:Bifunctional glycosyltransferase n=1 Tax=hydrocarbon metagenome TaxID=938273 RepID=A0A0W8FPN1_9ZZZZ|nr:glycosyltransferase involved in cell wall biogenesis-like protein [Smithella sp. ME-1]